jgi:hypothetical protein
MVRLNSSISLNVVKIPKTPSRLATKPGTSLHSTIPLPSVRSENSRIASSVAGAVKGVGMSSSRCM